MIELAPQRKQGLSLSCPLIAASGSVGFANEASNLIALERFGALVTAPLSLRPRTGQPQPRLREVAQGVLLDHGDHNRGWHRTREKFGVFWARSRTPIIIHLAGPPSEWIELARRSEDTQGIAGLECDLSDVSLLPVLADLRKQCELPLLARLPYGGEALAEAAINAGVDALVCIAPPLGTARTPAQHTLDGQFYGPSVKPLAMHMLYHCRARVDAPIIAAGGVQDAADIADFLALGANAVMIDSLAWIDPNRVNQLLMQYTSASK